MNKPRIVSFPIVVSGPSGVGKTTLCHGLLKMDTHLAFSISATTRPPRSNEIDGKDYFFVKPDEFERMKTEQQLAEWALVHGHYYGTPKKWLDEQLERGISILLDIDVQGGVQIMESYPESVSIFVVPPTFKVLEERLRKRGSETEDALRLRLENALSEMEFITSYDYVVVNDTVDEAVARMHGIVTAERLKQKRILEGITWRQLIGLDEREVKT